MQNKKLNENALLDIYKNAHTALQSLSIIIPKTEDEDIKKELLDQYEAYEKLIGEISAFMKENGFEPKDINIFKKAMMWGSVNLNTLTDKSKEHLADLLVQGTTMGVTDIYALKNEMGEKLDEQTLKYADKLLSLEETFVERLKVYL